MLMEAQGIGFWLTKRAFLNWRPGGCGGRRAAAISYQELNGRVNRLSPGPRRPWA